MYFDKAVVIIFVLLLWFFSPKICKQIVGNDSKKKGEPFSTDWSSNMYGGQMPWNGWSY
jgi:hypothetical protein